MLNQYYLGLFQSVFFPTSMPLSIYVFFSIYIIYIYISSVAVEEIKWLIKNKAYSPFLPDFLPFANLKVSTYFKKTYAFSLSIPKSCYYFKIELINEIPHCNQMFFVSELARYCRFIQEKLLHTTGRIMILIHSQSELYLNQ